MKILLVLSVLLSLGTQAGTLTGVFVDASAPAQYKYLGVFKNKLGNTEYLVSFGEGTNFQSYNVGFLFSTYYGAKSSGINEDTSIGTVGMEQNYKFKATLTHLKNKTSFKGEYLITRAPEVKQYALKIDKLVEAEFDKYRRMSQPLSTTDLRKIFRQLDQDAGISGLGNNSEFPVYELQIEQTITVKAPSTAISAMRVTLSGTDDISRTILKRGSKWYKDNLEASNALMSKLDDRVDVSNMTFASFSNKVNLQGLSPRLKQALEKHLKVEILEEEGFECGNSSYNWTAASWILKDGSSLSYRPGTECD